MHDMFPDWVRELTADGDLSQVPLAEWWTAVEEFVDDASPVDVIDMVRVAYGHPREEFDTRWRQALRRHDPLSPLRGADRQVALLAGAAVLQAGTSEDHAPVALYGRRCADLAGWAPPFADVAVPEAQLRQRATLSRELPPWPTAKRFRVQTRTFDELMPPNDEQVSGAELRAVVGALASSMGDTVVRAAAATGQIAEAREAPLKEQSDVLVWLLSGRSKTTGTPWKDLSPETAAVCAAIEVVGLSRFNVGRPDHEALIAQAVASAGKPTKTTTDPAELATYVNEVCDHSDAESLDDLVPVLKLVSDSATADMKAEELGVRLHDELCLLRSITPTT